MLIGIMSDSHGKVPPLRQALNLFHRLGAEHLIHCGDVGGEETFDELAHLPLTFVWGNTDTPPPGLIAYLKTLRLIPPQEVPTTLTLAGKTFAIFHGHERGFDAALSSGRFDYICHGHTHQPRDQRIGKTRIINPGALHRAKPKTVAVLDLVTDTLTFHPIAL